MHFRTVNDLFSTVRRNLHKLPRDVDIVVGIPRSGMVAATAISLALHKQMADLSYLVSGRSIPGGSNRIPQNEGASVRSALIVDDSVNTGGSLAKARRAVAERWSGRAVFAAIYGLKSRHNEADIVLEVCPQPRAFEWNVMNHWVLSCACVDMDGVLCCDPTPEQNDDKCNYLSFLETATPLNTPTCEIHSIVTSRLERYRASTEGWLARHGIKYRHLHMLDLPSAEERRQRGINAEFKAAIYKSSLECRIFIESEATQASQIRRLTRKAVLCYEDMTFEAAGPSAKGFAKSALKTILPTKVHSALRTALGRAERSHHHPVGRRD